MLSTLLFSFSFFFVLCSLSLSLSSLLQNLSSFLLEVTGETMNARDSFVPLVACKR